MSLKKSYGLLFVLLLTPLVVVGVVQSVGPPTISVNLSSYGIYVYGSGWTANAPVILYYDVEDADHMVATVTANYAGNFQAYIPTNYVASVDAHTVIAVQGADKATAVHNVGAASPPDDRLLNPILNIKEVLSNPIEVINPPGESLNVNVTNTKPIVPVQFGGGHYFFIDPTEEFGWEEEFFLVPEGKMLVIEYISVRAIGNGVYSSNMSDSPEIHVRTAMDNLYQFHYLGVVEPQWRPEQYLSKPVKIYAQPNSYVSVSATIENPAQDYINVQCTMSGYLIDAP